MRGNDQNYLGRLANGITGAWPDSPGIRRLCVAVSTAEPDGADPARLGVQHHRFSSLLDELLLVPELEQLRLFRQSAGTDAGSGEIILLPVGIDEPAVITLLIGWLHDALRLARGGPAGRLRMAVHEGLTYVREHQFGGPAVTRARRLLTTPLLRATLTARPAADMAVMLSDHVVTDLNDFGHALPNGDLVRMDIADTSSPWPDLAWLLVLEHP